MVEAHYEHVNAEAAVSASTHDKDDADRIYAWLAAILLIVGGTARVAAIVPLTSAAQLGKTFADDGYYYLEIARNFVRTHSFTFDGLNLTNGFHPLWQLLLSIVAFVSVEDILFVRLVLGLGVILYVLTGWLLFRLVSKLGGSVAALGATLLWGLSPGLVRWQNQGMESTLFLPLLLLAILAINAFIENPDKLSRALYTGLIFGLLIWSRSDSILFVGIV